LIQLHWDVGLAGTHYHEAPESVQITYRIYADQYAPPEASKSADLTEDSPLFESVGPP
jgi:hypothetical protein